LENPEQKERWGEWALSNGQGAKLAFGNGIQKHLRIIFLIFTFTYLGVFNGI